MTDQIDAPTADQSEIEQAPKQKRKNTLRNWLIGAALLLLALLAIGFAILNSSIGKRIITDQIAQVAPASGLRFEVGRIEGDIFGEAVLSDVSVSDPQGVFLTIPEVELDWRPLSWLTRGLDIRNLVARRGTLLRLPELLPGDPDAPILPDFDIRIDRFEIDRLTLAQGIVGDTSPVITMLAEADIRDGRVFVKADSDLGESDTLAALIDARPDADKFDIKLDYNAPAGGVLAGLTGADASYRALIDGDGSWSDWDGALVVRREDERFVSVKLTNQSGQYGVLGQAYPQEFLSGLPAELAGQAVNIAAFGTLEDSIFDGELAVKAAALKTSGSGAINLADNRFDDFALTARLLKPDVFGETFQLENGQIAATLDGGFRDLSIEHRLTLDQLVSGETRLAQLSQEGTATYDGTRFTLPLGANVGRVETGNALIDPRLIDGTLQGTLVYTGGKILSDDLQINFPEANARLALRGNTDLGTYALVGPVAVNGLPLENVGIVNGGGNIDFRIGSNIPWTLQADISARIPRVTNATLANLAGPDIRINGGVSLGATAPLDFQNLRVAASKLTLVMDGRIANGTTSVAGRGTQADYGDFTVEASLNDAGPNAVLVFANPLPAAGLKDVRVAIAPSDDGFLIETEGQSLLGEFDGILNLVAPADGPTQIVVNSLNVWKTSVSGNLVLGDGGADGRLLLSGGGLDGRIGLATRDGGQGFAIDIDANSANFGGATPISLRRADIEARGYLKDGNSTISGNMSGEGLSYGTLFVGRMAARAELENGSGTATASLAGRRGSRFALQLNAGIAPGRIAVAGQGSFAGRNIRMPRRAVLTQVDDGGWQLQPTQISYGDGALVASGEFGGGTTEMDLSLKDMPLALVDIAVADLGLGGDISGKIDFRSNGSGVPVGNARVKIDNLTRSGLVLTSRPIDVALVSRLSADRLDTRAVIDEGGERRGRLQARITGLPQSGALFQRLQAGNLFGQLRFNGPASAIWRLSGVEAFDLTGPLSAAANITGSLANPRVRGSVASDNLRVQSALSGTDVQKVSMRGSFAGSRLTLSRFSGSTSNGGSISGSGTIDLENLGPRGPVLDIKVSAKNANLLNANGLGATITGPLRIVSNGIGGTIAGKVRIDRANWKLGSADVDMALPRIKTREINIPADIAPSSTASAPWRYLINANAPSRVDVDGMGLESEWSADIQLRGTTDDPRIGGEARVVRGDYSFAGTRFELTRGRIDFDASVPIDPRIDIVAETEKDGLDVSVTVQGNGLNPEIAFSSTPLLPEEEILSRLLFGGSITSLSATDALQLGTALASLRGGAGLDPINQLRSAIGLDRLRIVSADPAINRGTGVALGKNIGRRFYVEIITDGRGYSATEAEFRVTSWLSLLASVSTIGRESVVAEISRDY